MIKIVLLYVAHCELQSICADKIRDGADGAEREIHYLYKEASFIAEQVLEKY